MIVHCACFVCGNPKGTLAAADFILIISMIHLLLFPRGLGFNFLAAGFKHKEQTGRNKKDEDCDCNALYWT